MQRGWSETMDSTVDIFNDPQTGGVKEHYALIYAPKPTRKRFPENCVEVVASEDEARKRANPDKQLHAARVVGPSRSSEGFKLYYLVRWLD
jgi:hypothetical protein